MSFHPGRRARRLGPESALPPALFAIYLLHALLFRHWLIDDAGISFAYARNLVHGHGLVAQPGLPPVEGFSNPLWTFLLAPLFLFDPIDPTTAVKLVSLALVLGTFLLVGRIARALFGSSPASSLVTVGTLGALSLNTSFVVWTTSGLENALYAFLLALYCLCLLHYALLPHPGRHPSPARVGMPRIHTLVPAGFCAAGLALTRPDGIVFLAALPAVFILRAWERRAMWRKEGGREWAGLLLSLAAALAPVAAYLLFRRLYFGDFLPNTYHAKGGPSAREVVRLLLLRGTYVTKTADLLDGMFSTAGPALLLLFPVGAALFVLLRRRPPVLYLAPALLCAWAIYCLLPADWMGEYRFATPFFLVFYLVLFGWLASMAELFPRMPARAPAFAGVVPPQTGTAGGFGSGATAFLAALVGTVLVVSLWIYLPRSRAFAARPVVPFQVAARECGIRFNRYADELHLPEASLLCPDLGGTLYFSRHRIYDLAGLCDPTIARLFAQPDRSGLRDYVFDHLRPTFIHIHDSWSYRSGFDSDPRFRRLYAPIEEVPSEWARARGLQDVFSGDYVRKDAVASESDLLRLQRRMAAGEGPSGSGGRPRPFPRG